jgi:hypothetical protein
MPCVSADVNRLRWRKRPIISTYFWRENRSADRTLIVQDQLIFHSRDLHQGCQIFLGLNIPKWEKINQMTANNTKWPYMILKGRKIF